MSANRLYQESQLDNEDDLVFDDAWKDSIALSSYMKMKNRSKDNFLEELLTPIQNHALNQRNIPTSMESKARSPKALQGFNESSIYDDPDYSPLKMRSISKNQLFDSSTHDDIQGSDENVDLVGLKVLLKTALRDKGKLQSLNETFQEQLSNLKDENNHLTKEKSDVFQRINAGKKWKLPCSINTIFYSRKNPFLNKVKQVHYFCKWKLITLTSKVSLLSNHLKVVKFNKYLLANLTKIFLSKLRSYWMKWSQITKESKIVCFWASRALEKKRRSRLNQWAISQMKRFSGKKRALKSIFHKLFHVKKLQNAFKKLKTQYLNRQILSLTSHKLKWKLVLYQQILRRFHNNRLLIKNQLLLSVQKWKTFSYFKQKYISLSNCLTLKFIKFILRKSLIKWKVESLSYSRKFLEITQRNQILKRSCITLLQKIRIENNLQLTQRFKQWKVFSYFDRLQDDKLNHLLVYFKSNVSKRLFLSYFFSKWKDSHILYKKEKTSSGQLNIINIKQKTISRLYLKYNLFLWKQKFVESFRFWKTVSLLAKQQEQITFQQSHFFQETQKLNLQIQHLLDVNENQSTDLQQLQHTHSHHKLHATRQQIQYFIKIIDHWLVFNINKRKYCYFHHWKLCSIKQSHHSHSHHIQSEYSRRFIEKTFLSFFLKWKNKNLHSAFFTWYRFTKQKAHRIKQLVNLFISYDRSKKENLKNELHKAFFKWKQYSRYIYPKHQGLVAKVVRLMLNREKSYLLQHVSQAFYHWHKALVQLPKRIKLLMHSVYQRWSSHYQRLLIDAFSHWKEYMFGFRNQVLSTQYQRIETQYKAIVKKSYFSSWKYFISYQRKIYSMCLQRMIHFMQLNLHLAWNRWKHLAGLDHQNSLTNELNLKHQKIAQQILNKYLRVNQSMIKAIKHAFIIWHQKVLKEKASEKEYQINDIQTKYLSSLKDKEELQLTYEMSLVQLTNCKVKLLSLKNSFIEHNALFHPWKFISPIFYRWKYYHLTQKLIRKLFPWFMQRISLIYSSKCHYLLRYSWWKWKQNIHLLASQERFIVHQNNMDKLNYLIQRQQDVYTQYQLSQKQLTTLSKAWFHWNILIQKSKQLKGFIRCLFSKLIQRLKFIYFIHWKIRIMKTVNYQITIFSEFFQKWKRYVHVLQSIKNRITYYLRLSLQSSLCNAFNRWKQNVSRIHKSLKIINKWMSVIELKSNQIKRDNIQKSFCLWKRLTLIYQRYRSILFSVYLPKYTFHTLKYGLQRWKLYIQRLKQWYDIPWKICHSVFRKANTKIYQKFISKAWKRWRDILIYEKKIIFHSEQLLHCLITKYTESYHHRLSLQAFSTWHRVFLKRRISKRCLSLSNPSWNQTVSKQSNLSSPKNRENSNVEPLTGRILDLTKSVNEMYSIMLRDKTPFQLLEHANEILNKFLKHDEESQNEIGGSYYCHLYLSRAQDRTLFRTFEGSSNISSSTSKQNLKDLPLQLSELNSEEKYFSAVISSSKPNPSIQTKHFFAGEGLAGKCFQSQLAVLYSHRLLHTDKPGKSLVLPLLYPRNSNNNDTADDICLGVLHIISENITADSELLNYNQERILSFVDKSNQNSIHQLRSVIHTAQQSQQAILEYGISQISISPIVLLPMSMLITNLLEIYYQSYYLIDENKYPDVGSVSYSPSKMNQNLNSSFETNHYPSEQAFGVSFIDNCENNDDEERYFVNAQRQLRVSGAIPTQLNLQLSLREQEQMYKVQQEKIHFMSDLIQKLNNSRQNHLEQSKRWSNNYQILLKKYESILISKQELNVELSKLNRKLKKFRNQDNQINEINQMLLAIQHLTL